MKKYFLFLIFLLFSNMLFAQKISEDQAFQIILNNDKNIHAQKNVLYYPSPLSPKKELINTKNLKSPDFISWFFFVDEFPNQSWEHPCYYAFVNSNTGEYIKIEGTLPPDLEELKVKVMQPMPGPGKLFNFTKKEDGIKSATTYDASNDYAVIISGGKNYKNNWFRYWNDCSAIYSALINVYNYSPSHIYVLMSDGTSSGNDRLLSRAYDSSGNVIYTNDSSPLDLDGNGTNDINYSATKSNISTVFNTLSGILNSDDHLFVFTTDHGGQESGDDVYMNLWGETIRDDQFADELDKVNAGKITVLMGQCNSGGFVNDLSGDGRIISTACTANEFSWSLADGTYDEYLYHWISAVVGETPEGTAVDADDNNDGWVSMREAFDYANANDNAHVNGVFVPGEGTFFETPQYNSTPLSLGTHLALNGQIPSISGPKKVCDEAIYTIQNFDQLPEGVTVEWSVNNNILTLVSGQGTEACVFRKNEPGISLVQAEILLNSQVISTLSFLVSTEIKVSIVGNTDMLGCGKTRAWQCSMNCPSWDFEEPVRINWTLEGDGQRYYGSGPTFSIGTSCGRITSLNGSRQPINTPHAIYTLRLEVTLPDGTTYSAPDERFEIFGYIEVFGFTLDKNLRIYPTPTTGETTLILETSSAEKAFDATAEWDLEVYDNMQNLKLRTQKLKGNSTRINTQNWKEGVYMVRVKYNDEIITGKLIVKK